MNVLAVHRNPAVDVERLPNFYDPKLTMKDSAMRVYAMISAALRYRILKIDGVEERMASSPKSITASCVYSTASVPVSFEAMQ